MSEPYRALTAEDHKFVCDVLAITSGALYLINTTLQGNRVLEMALSQAILARCDDALRARFFTSEPDEVCEKMVEIGSDFAEGVFKKYHGTGVGGTQLLDELDTALKDAGAQSDLLVDVDHSLSLDDVLKNLKNLAGGAK